MQHQIGAFMRFEGLLAASRRGRRCVLAWAACISAEFCWDVKGHAQPPMWKDASQPFGKRAADLASRLSFEDMVKNLN
eukprot:SAG31_NODE_42494_length_271_cov_0.889535_1_plen_77_part_01